VLKNVEFPAIIGGMNKKGRRARAIRLLSFLGLKSKLQFRPFNLSGGEQQRVAIARSLMNNPAIILADEPTGNLDTKTGTDVFSLLELLSNKFKRTIIMVTHNTELAANTHRSIHIKDGRIEKQVVNFAT
jgi:putative ABC transport system ATP-binding protein